MLNGMGISYMIFLCKYGYFMQFLEKEIWYWIHTPPPQRLGLENMTFSADLDITFNL